jgi:hypothetical protein
MITLNIDCTISLKTGNRTRNEQTASARWPWIGSAGSAS